MFRPLFHLSVVSINISTVLYDYMYLDIPLPVKGMEKFILKGRSMYLTTWCMILQTIYHLIALLNDIVGTNASTQSPPIVRQIKDILFSSAFPVAIYVSVLYWGIHAIDDSMLAPKHVLEVIPPVINHVLHTTVSVFIIVELLLAFKNYPSRKFGLALLHSFFFTYTIWFFYICGKTGSGVYPLYDYLDIYGRISFLIFTGILTSTTYIIGEKLNNFICSNNNDFYYIKNGSDIKNKSK